MRIFFGICIVLLITCFSACSTTETYAPVVDATQIEALPKNGVYRVSANDTLYSIAWRYGLDYRDLAQRNNIAHPYHIETGQLLYLATKPPYQTPNRSILDMRPMLGTHSMPSAVPPPSTSNKVSALPIEHRQKQPPQGDKIISLEQEPTTQVNHWRRPANGPIIGSYSAQNKGLNFGGHLGDPIFATAAGKIVYCGNGLRGYGNLIIIKHNSTFLTAYAHNNNVLVKEGEWVQAGQKIAEMGSTGTQRIMLHFEIRRSGKPVNPAYFLINSNKEIKNLF